VEGSSSILGIREVGVGEMEEGMRKSRSVIFGAVVLGKALMHSRMYTYRITRTGAIAKRV